MASTHDTHPLKAFRKAAGLSQRRAAQLVGISQPHWCCMEAGKAFARPTVARRISDLTGVPIDLLLNFTDSEMHTDEVAANG